MVQLDYQRLDNLLNYLITLNTPITLDELSRVLNVSTRTLRNDIKQVNDHIIKHGASINLIRKEGYVLKYVNKKNFEKFWFDKDSGTFLFTTSESRINFITRMLLTSDIYLSQEYLLSTLFISQNTLYNDLRVIREKFNKFQLKISNKSNIGYTVSGTEENIRDATIHLLFKDDLVTFLNPENSLIKDVCNNINYSQFTSIYNSFLENMPISESDYFQRNFFSYTILTLSRIKLGKNINNYSNDVELLPKVKEQFLDFISKICRQFNIQISNSEGSYLRHILSENFPNVFEDSNINCENLDLAVNIVSDILNNLSNSISDSWIHDPSLKQSLINHLSRVLKIHTIDGVRINPILDSVKNNFPFAFEIALNEIRLIETKYQLSFTEDEISYIALYFESSIEKYKIKQYHTLSIAVICGTGQTLSSIIENRIYRTFQSNNLNVEKLSYSEYLCKKEELTHDFIISTIPIVDSYENKNIFYLDLSNFEQNFRKIESNIKRFNFNRIPFSLFDEANVYYINKVLSKNEVIKMVSDKLIENDYVGTDFYDMVMQREEISNTLLDNTIAIPHPLTNEIIRKSSISVVIAPKGVSWTNNIKVKFILVLAIKNKDIKNVEYIYEKIIDFTSSPSSQEELLRDPSINTLKKLFEK
ncbi:BglG family transcription antiterminator [Streptococcus uberis]|uniref:BglG family transcription antiterminator n=1 Tax=Streptococcus uberis TaxID=1349 RepID=UPI0006202C78|nr:PTS sugar transporter subunit IIA [Streptococcus uberis]KKF45293.1 transcriptional regulator [Streptococcus uberis EF20/0145]